MEMQVSYMTMVLNTEQQQVIQDIFKAKHWMLHWKVLPEPTIDTLLAYGLDYIFPDNHRPIEKPNNTWRKSNMQNSQLGAMSISHHDQQEKTNVTSWQMDNNKISTSTHNTQEITNNNTTANWKVNTMHLGISGTEIFVPGTSVANDCQAPAQTNLTTAHKLLLPDDQVRVQGHIGANELNLAFSTIISSQVQQNHVHMPVTVVDSVRTLEPGISSLQQCETNTTDPELVIKPSNNSFMEQPTHYHSDTDNEILQNSTNLLATDIELLQTSEELENQLDAKGLQKDGSELCKNTKSLRSRRSTNLTSSHQGNNGHETEAELNEQRQFTKSKSRTKDAKSKLSKKVKMKQKPDHKCLSLKQKSKMTSQIVKQLDKIGRGTHASAKKQRKTGQLKTVNKSTNSESDTDSDASANNRDSRTIERFSCSQCSYLFLSASTLWEHMRNKHPEVSEAVTFEEWMFTRSMIDVKEPEPKPGHVQCPACDKYYPPHTLRRHCYAMHRELMPKFTCRVCGKQYRKRDDLRVHVRAEKHDCFSYMRQPHLCDLCGKSLATLMSLKEHKLICGSHIEKNITCEHCGAQFKARSHLRCHRRIVHTFEPIICQVCGQTYKNKKALQDHMKRHNEANRKHGCDECGKLFFSKTLLREHIRIHTKEKPFQCRFCDYKCAVKHNILKHAKSRHKQLTGAQCKDYNAVMRPLNSDD